MSKKSAKKNKRLLAVCCILMALAVAAAGFFAVHKMHSGNEAQDVLAQMEAIVPGLGQEDGYSSGEGRDPLTMIMINDMDIVGCLEIPSIDLRAPVLNQKEKRECFATWDSGSPAKGRFRISGNKQDVFRKLSKTAPKDRVIFTDLDGVRYEYEVTSQLNLKNWDEGQYDLMLCYDVDDRTQFVVGCMRSL